MPHLCDCLPSTAGDLPQRAQQRTHYRQVFPEQDRSRTLGQPEQIQIQIQIPNNNYMHWLAVVTKNKNTYNSGFITCRQYICLSAVRALGVSMRWVESSTLHILPPGHLRVDFD